MLRISRGREMRAFLKVKLCRNGNAVEGTLVLLPATCHWPAMRNPTV